MKSKIDADNLEKLSKKIMRIIEDVKDPEAFAVINFCFTKLIIERLGDPFMAKAAMITLMQNTATSIDLFFEEEDDLDEEHIH